jgi:hypothetical protein
MKKWPIFLVIVSSIALIFSQDVKADQVVKSYKASQGPLVDGLETEDVWKNAEAVTIFDPIAQVQITIKTVYTDATIFFLVSFPDKDESRKHRSWAWNKLKMLLTYGTGKPTGLTRGGLLMTKSSDYTVMPRETLMN